MGNDVNHGYFEARATHGDNADGIVSNRTKLVNSNEVNIRVSMFFDGTNNNKFNTEGRLEFFKKLHGQEHNAVAAAVYEERLRSGKSGLKIDDSYSNDYSNVARLFNYYDDTSNKKTELIGCVYIEGIATTSDGEDIIGGDDKPFPGGAFGAGRTGILKKVEKGCYKLAELCKELIEDDEIAVLTVDVFGFSRGAAAARNFIYEITQDEKPEQINTSAPSITGATTSYTVPAQPAHGALGKAFIENEIKFEGEIKIAFAGLFDTVPSYWKGIGDGGTKVLHLDAVGKAQDVLHLTAMDERRKKFALASVTKSKGSAYEKALPGVHSDIGGAITQL
ncbi:MAG: T6SS phospholipase effector Tle1-like catalytic domain-containing protein [Bacteroidales bacterium]